MAYVENFKDLIVWQRAMELVEDVYRLTKLLPQDEKFGLVSQMRRCGVSIPSNIAEGKKRKSKADFVQFLRIADGSAAELETQLLIAAKVYGLEISRTEGILLEVQKMLATLLAKLHE